METRGYTRPLFSGDDTAADVEALGELGASKVTAEVSHRSRVHRTMAIADLSPGDVLIVTSLERLDTRLPGLVRVLLELRQRGIRLQCPVAPAVETDADAVTAMLSALVDFQHRVHSSAARTADYGGRRGRPRALDATGVAMAVELQRAGRTIPRIAQILGVGQSAVRTALNSPGAEGGTREDDR
ncbi:MAG TPA: recombinase family protein [Microbacterium sp.]|uniref:recombinase family protein n=1 Tax=Microbacterium sp. TaxID=51671 RepID=UPI002F9359F1